MTEPEYIVTCARCGRTHSHHGVSSPPSRYMEKFIPTKILCRRKLCGHMGKPSVWARISHGN